MHIEALQEYGPSPIHRKTFITHFLLRVLSARGTECESRIKLNEIS